MTFRREKGELPPVTSEHYPQVHSDGLEICSKAAGRKQAYGLCAFLGGAKADDGVIEKRGPAPPECQAHLGARTQGAQEGQSLMGCFGGSSFTSGWPDCSSFSPAS